MDARIRLLSPVLSLTVAVAACAGAASPSPSTPTTPAATGTAAAPAAPSETAICADAARLRTSMTALHDLKLADVGVSGVTTALTDVLSAAQALGASGRALVGPPISQLVVSVQALQTTLTGLGDQPKLGAKLVAVKTAIDQIKTAATTSSPRSGPRAQPTEGRAVGR